MAVALVALFVALGGGAYAAVSMPANSVGSKQLKNGAVIASKLANNAITSAKVKDGSLLAQDFAAGQLPAGPKGATGAMGPQGPAGPTGAPGAAGATGSAGGSLSGEFTTTNTSLGVGAPPTVLAGSGTITTVAGENHLVLNGYVQAYYTGATPPWVEAQCSYLVDGSVVGSSPISYFFTGSAGQVTVVARPTVSAGTHTVQVQCTATGGSLSAAAGDYTMIATG
jgi:hypothetical protein